MKACMKVKMQAARKARMKAQMKALMIALMKAQTKAFMKMCEHIMAMMAEVPPPPTPQSSCHT